MAVVIETTAGDLTVDLFIDERPLACLNFLKLCRLKYYNYNLFHTIQQGFIAQTGDPTGVGTGGSSIWGVLDADAGKRYFRADVQPRIRHTEPGLLSMVSQGDGLIGSQFFFTLGADLTSLDDGTGHCVIGQVTEGVEVLRTLNTTICDDGHRPYQDVRITHTVVLDDPFEAPRNMRTPSRSPSPSAERLQGGRIGADEDIDDTDGKTELEVAEMLQEREARARATILEIVGDLPDADMAPPENVLFVCKLNPVTSDDDLEIIFSRFGRVVGCEVIRDRVTGDSLQYAFVEFEDAKTCEQAYIKMDNVLIDDRRIHVDFSQSVAKVQWRGKGRGLIYKDGQKGDRLNFGDLKSSNGTEKKKGHQQQHQQQQRQPVSRNHGRPEDRRRGSTSPPHRQPVNRFAGDERRRDVRDQRAVERRGRSRSRDRDQRQKRTRSRSRSRDVQRLRQNKSRSRSTSPGNRRRAPRPHSRSRSQERRRVPKSRSRSRSRSKNRDNTQRTDRHRRSDGSDAIVHNQQRGVNNQSSRTRAERRSRSLQRHVSTNATRRTRSRSPDRRDGRRERALSSERSSAVVRPAKHQRARSTSSVDSATDSDDSSSEDEEASRRVAKKSKGKKSKKSTKKKSKKSRKRTASSNDDTDSSSEEERHKKRKSKKSKKQRK